MAEELERRERMFMGGSKSPVVGSLEGEEEVEGVEGSVGAVG